MPSAFPGPAYRIVTPRLVLRCWNPQDAPLLKNAVQANVDHLLPWLPFARNEPEELQVKIERMRHWRSRFDSDGDYVYGIFNAEESRVVGGTGLHKRVGDQAFEIGYWIDQELINQGYATEVSAALVKTAFEIMGARRIEIHCDPLNHRSAAVPRKLGFIHEATLRERFPTSESQWTDIMIWSIFAGDYPQSPAQQIKIQAFDSANRQIM
ncbi:MAG TPA: GNAT family protein [Bellilinea sp.]